MLFCYAPLHKIRYGIWVKGKGRRARHWQVAAGLIYGQVKKVYRRCRLVRVTQQMRCGTAEELRTALSRLGLSGRLNTAFIERVNLTLRQSVSTLIRRSWSTAQHAPQLLLRLEWWWAYSHFAGPHEALRVVLPAPLERGEPSSPTVLAANPCHGSRAHFSTMVRAETTEAALPLDAVGVA